MPASAAAGDGQKPDPTRSAAPLPGWQQPASQPTTPGPASHLAPPPQPRLPHRAAGSSHAAPPAPCPCCPALRCRRSLRMYNSLVERCFRDCVDSFRRKDLDAAEEKVRPPLAAVGWVGGWRCVAACACVAACLHRCTTAGLAARLTANGQTWLGETVDAARCTAGRHRRRISHSHTLPLHPSCPPFNVRPAVRAVVLRQVHEAQRAGGPALRGAVQRGGEPDGHAHAAAAGRRQVSVRARSGRGGRRRQPCQAAVCVLFPSVLGSLQSASAACCSAPVDRQLLDPLGWYRGRLGRAAVRRCRRARARKSARWHLRCCHTVGRWTRRGLQQSGQP